ncbi:UNVERIFIED_CONTAM: hypothetical protein HDU68_009167 [Siphonaria sp. JEL0065]|nr:hypothetical protein HDU68_009167 [Siphonaria sp. JEL0065]
MKETLGSRENWETVARAAETRVDVPPLPPAPHIGVSETVPLVDVVAPGAPGRVSSIAKPKTDIFNGMNIALSGSHAGANNVANKAIAKKIADNHSGIEKEYAMFGPLCLPSAPYQWTTDEVAEWAVHNQGTAGVVEFIKDQDVNGHALLLLKAADLPFSTVGSRVRFNEALNSLKSINASKLASLEGISPPPPFS